MEIFMTIIFIGAGIFSICGAVFDWDWFMNNYKARPFMKIFGRTGTRIIYALIGIFVIAIAVGVLILT